MLIFMPRQLGPAFGMFVGEPGCPTLRSVHVASDGGFPSFITPEAELVRPSPVHDRYHVLQPT